MSVSTTFLNNFDFISDPRLERSKKHNLFDILLLAVTAVIPGFED